MDYQKRRALCMETFTGDVMNEQQRIVSDALYCLAMRMTDAGAKHVDALIEGFCELAGVKYPPQRMD